ncbi:hypothetical protein JCM31271_18400 [Halorubrum trueperi]
MTVIAILTVIPVLSILAASFPIASAIALAALVGVAAGITLQRRCPEILDEILSLDAGDPAPASDR